MIGTEMLNLAAAVIWPFKDLNRPLGELLTSGEVKERDLGWAAWKAYDPTVKWAAAVQLKAQDLRQIALSPAAARKVIWPFKNLKRPIGDLLDTQIINLHDLAYAVAQAYAPEVRNAAAVLGAEIVRRQLKLEAPQPTRSVPPPLEQATVTPPAAAVTPAAPAPAQHQAMLPPRYLNRQASVTPTAPAPAQPMQIIDGSDYLTHQVRQKRRWVIVLGAVMLYAWWAALVISTVAIIANLLGLEPVPLGWGVVTGILLLGAILIQPRLERYIEEYDHYHAGQKGEQLVTTGLQRALKRPWVLFRNVVLPGQQADIDAVLVGPQGIYALEIKAFTGYHRNIGERWQRRYTFFWRDLSRNPSRQARGNAQLLHDYLQQCDVTVWVEPRVVWASRSKLWLKKPAVTVWQISQGGFIGEDLTRGKPLDEATRRQIVALLKANNLSRQRKGKVT